MKKLGGKMWDMISGTYTSIPGICEGRLGWAEWGKIGLDGMGRLRYCGMQYSDVRQGWVKWKTV